MPRGLIGISHRFNFVSHDFLSFFFLFMQAGLLCMSCILARKTTQHAVFCK
jgi:hypothetical protein